jgi:hypothetical protein
VVVILVCVWWGEAPAVDMSEKTGLVTETRAPFGCADNPAEKHC